MIRIADAHSSRASAGISMRAWLYLGFAVLGVSLMGLEQQPDERVATASEPARVQPATTTAESSTTSTFVAGPATSVKVGSVVLR